MQRYTKLLEYNAEKGKKFQEEGKTGHVPVAVNREGIGQYFRSNRKYSWTIQNFFRSIAFSAGKLEV
jgi:hypothetical protein